jgi:hypothetical protein
MVLRRVRAALPELHLSPGPASRTSCLLPQIFADMVRAGTTGTFPDGRPENGNCHRFHGCDQSNDLRIHGPRARNG